MPLSPGERMSETSVPKHRRRRYVVAIMVAFALLAWWLWPRADARFVGRWEAHNGDETVTQPACVIELRSNGRGRTTFTDGSGPDDFVWSVDGEFYRTGLIDGPVWQTMFRKLFAKIWMKLTGNPYLQGVYELRIEQIADDEIKLMSSEKDATVIFRRVAQ
jgi:hypothetical protein